MKKKVENCYNEAVKITSPGKNEKYVTDLNFALLFYELFRKDFSFTSEKASDDDIWRYIQMKVVPGLVFNRWEGSDSNKRINENRFWKDSRRIWMKSLWWYVHLSLVQDSIEKTKEILITNTTDSISQLVERPGAGYRVDLCRAIMFRFSASPKKSEDLLRKVMKLNTARCTTIEPLLVDEGIDDYVNSLFEFFGA